MLLLETNLYRIATTGSGNTAVGHDTGREITTGYAI